MRVTLIETDQVHIEALISRDSSHAPWHIRWLVDGETPVEPPMLLRNCDHEADAIKHARNVAARLFAVPVPVPADLPDHPPSV